MVRCMDCVHHGHEKKERTIYHLIGEYLNCICLLEGKIIPSERGYCATPSWCPLTFTGKMRKAIEKEGKSYKKGLKKTFTY